MKAVSYLLTAAILLPVLAQADSMVGFHELWQLDAKAANSGQCTQMIEVSRQAFFGADSVVVNRGADFNAYMQNIYRMGEQEMNNVKYVTQYSDTGNTLTVQEFDKHPLIGYGSKPSSVVTIHLATEQGIPSALTYDYADKSDTKQSSHCNYAISDLANPVQPAGCQFVSPNKAIVSCVFQPAGNPLNNSADGDENCDLKSTDGAVHMTVARHKIEFLSLDTDSDYWIVDLATGDFSGRVFRPLYKDERTIEDVTNGKLTCQ
jgi:hypothetical protein